MSKILFAKKHYESLASCKTLASRKKVVNQYSIARARVNNADPASTLVAEAQDLIALRGQREPLRGKCDLLGRGAAAALDAGGNPAETATVLRPLVDLARREFGAEHEVTARLAADLTRRPVWKSTRHERAPEV